MSPSLRALLAGIVDYAGLFPPAKLPLDQAIRNYARYRNEPEAWMLGRFVCPAARLAELAPFQDELFQSGAAFRFTALGRGGAGAEAFLTGLHSDLRDIASFRQRHAAVDGYEVRLPPEVCASDRDDRLRDLLTAAAQQLRQQGPPALTPFYEIPAGSDARAVAAVTALATGGVPPAGLKLRCGGVEAAAFPPSGQVAAVIAACRDARVPLKFTAGLHHPVRRLDRELGVAVHGFLNVFGAGVLAWNRGLAEEQLLAILNEEDPAGFRFGEAGFHWGDFHVTAEEVAAARRDGVVSFGSCSFDEPRDGLRSLGLLPEGAPG